LEHTVKNNTRFGLNESHSGLAASDAPMMFRLRQHFARPVEHDIEAAVRRELAPIVARVSPGQSIAVTGSSRGIVNFLEVIKTSVAMLLEAGAQPFVVPGMGSHGGATVEGQTAVLADTHGITEASVGCPIRATMDVVQVGTTESGFPVYQDKLCYEADGVLVVNRVKPHTGFTEVVESGLAKMLVIGLGKQAGASRIHQQALRIDMGQMILDASKIIVEADRPRLIGGLALVENAFKETAKVCAVSLDTHAALVAAESQLLKQAYELLPRLPFADIDVLIVDEIGKNISGSGMDTNVIGRKPGLTSPTIQCIYVRGLTEETHGNGTGIGHADLIPRSMFDELDLHSTYMNAYTAKKLLVGKIPMLVESELQAMQVFGGFREGADPASLRAVWIKNTSKLEEMWASSALLEEAEAGNDIEVLSAPAPVVFDGDSNMQLPPT
jgi:hypothetical protein